MKQVESRLRQKLQMRENYRQRAAELALFDVGHSSGFCAARPRVPFLCWRASGGGKYRGRQLSVPGTVRGHGEKVAVIYLLDYAQSKSRKRKTSWNLEKKNLAQTRGEWLLQL